MPAIRFKSRVSQHSVCFLQNNARLHTTPFTIELLQKLKGDLLPSSLYSPDLALLDFHMFGQLKKFFWKEELNSNVVVIDAVQIWVDMQSQDFYSYSIMKLLSAKTIVLEW